MTVKVYVSEKPLFLCDIIGEDIMPYVQQNNVQIIDTLPDPAVSSMIQALQAGVLAAGILVYGNVSALQEAVWQQFTLVPAAGGLVINERNEVCCMFRRGKWDLPKGKVEAGETIEACAVREVEEETGLAGLILQHYILTTCHTYFEKGVHILKESHWYAMQASSSQLLVPQTSEDIQEVRWIGTGALEEVLSNTYASIKDVLDRAGLITADSNKV